jgi:Flp pilus assembly pilin Flp
LSRPEKQLRPRLLDTEGTTMVEYALMVCLCALIAVAAISTLGVRLGGHFDTAASALSSGKHPRGCDVGGGQSGEKNPNC